MGFYEEISRYYDLIFPVGEEQVKFIKEAAGPEGSKVLDVACGAGGYSAVLAEAGYRMTAVDIDSAMVERAREKFEGRSLTVHTEQADMRELAGSVTGKFRCAFCIGNSIVHLGSTGDILTALKQMYGLLEESGTLVLQIINYDRILKQGVNELPPIHDPAAGIDFIRKYQYDKEKGVVNFNTVLKVDREGSPKIFENSIGLLPLLSNKMMELLEQARFKKIKFYGDFNKAPFTDSSYMLVAKAVK